MSNKITRVVVEEVGGLQVEYQGHGTASVVNTFTPGDREAGVPEQKVRYLSVILSLPVHDE